MKNALVLKPWKNFEYTLIFFLRLFFVKYLNFKSYNHKGETYSNCQQLSRRKFIYAPLYYLYYFFSTLLYFSVCDIQKYKIRKIHLLVKNKEECFKLYLNLKKNGKFQLMFI